MERLLPFDIVGPAGTRVTVTPASTTDRVRDLAGALGLPPDRPLLVDGDECPPGVCLTAIPGLVAGVAVTSPDGVPTACRGGPDPSRRAEPPAVEWAVVTGPACRPWTPLAPGRHRVGRAAACALRIDDPDVEPHHGALEVGADGNLWFVQLAGRVPARLGGQPCTGRTRIDGEVALQIGSSALRFRRPVPDEDGTARARCGSLGPIPGDPWRRVVRRSSGVLPGDARTTPAPIRVPTPPGDHHGPPATGLAGAAVAVLGATIVGLLLGNAMFTLFALIGAGASIVTWGAGAIAAARDRRRNRRRYALERRAFGASLDTARERIVRRRRALLPDLAEVLGALSRLDPSSGAAAGIWHRRPGPSDPLVAVVGRGDVVVPIALDGDATGMPEALQVAVVRAERIADGAATLSLAAGESVALHGPGAGIDALARAVVVHLATTTGPADWRLAIVTADGRRWEWARWLPHVRGAGGSPLVVRSREVDVLAESLSSPTSGESAGDGPRLLVVTDDPTLLVARTGPLRRLLDCRGAACLVLVADGEVPAICSRTLTVGATGGATWSGDVPEDDRADSIRVAGCTAGAAEAAARRLAACVDPEEPGGGIDLPAGVSVIDVRRATSAPETVAEIARFWSDVGPDPPPVALVGCAADGVVELDLTRDGPHGLIAGTTGAGKSELLRSLVLGLAASSPPDLLSLVLVDYKGGATFDACARLPHTVGVVTDLDGGLAERALVSLEAELRRRESLLRGAGADDLAAYRQVEGHARVARLVVIVDEFAAMRAEVPDFVDALVSVAQRGRSLGIHLVLATQRPAGIITDDIRANTNLRIALRVADPADAIDVVGVARPAFLPRTVPGRAVLRLGPDEVVEFQTASCSGPAVEGARRLTVDTATTERHIGRRSGTSELASMVGAIRAAATVAGASAARRPWVDPLPDVLDPREVPRGAGAPDGVEAVGLIDDPGAQCRHPLRRLPGGGTLALIGAPRAGVTTAMLEVVAAWCRASSPAALHVYALDGRGDGALDVLGDVPHCGAVVRSSERERTHRLLARLVDGLDRVRRASLEEPRRVLVVDALDAVRATLDTVEDAPAAANLDRLLVDGASAGLAILCAVDARRAHSVPAAERWVFALDDPTARSALGVSAGAACAVPGRFQIASTGLTAQIALRSDRFAGVPTGPVDGAPGRVEALPRLVDARSLCPPRAASWADPAGGGALEHAGAGGRPRRPDLLPVGLAGDAACGDGRFPPAVLEVPAGDHVLVAGGARTGRSTALRRLESAWRMQHPEGVVIRIDAPHAGIEIPTGARDGRRIAIVVDDAERVDHPALADLITSREPDVTVFAAARLDAVRAAYGHWTRDVARSRCGIILTAPGEVDGDVLGVNLPRRTLVDARPGLGWIVDRHGHRLVQVAVDRT